MKLRWLILIAFVGVTLIPVAFLGVWPQWKALQIEVDRVSDQHVLLARHMKLAMERYYRDAVSAFDLLVSSTIDGQSLEGTDRLMANVNFARICVARASNGRVVHPVGLKWAPCPASIPAKEMTLFASLAREGRTTLTGVLPNAAGHPTIYLLQRHGEVIAVGELHTDYLRELGKVVAFGQRGHAAIVDQHGLVIAHPREDWVQARKDISSIAPVARMMKGETGISKFYSPALEDDMIAGFTTVAGPGWGVMIPQPFAELEAKAETVQLFALTVITAGFLIAIAVAWFFSGYLTGPIAAMAEAARRLGAGDSAARADLGSRWAPLELRSLLQRFNTMADTIQRSQEELEGRVQERTRELQQREQDLRQAHDELERRIEERTRDLRVSEARFKDYAEAAADWFWEMDAELRFSNMSENVERIIGVPPEWHYGKTREDILGDDTDQDAWAKHLTVLQQHRPFRNFEYQRCGEGVEPRWLRVNGIPVFDSEGDFVGYRGTGSDITEQKMAEQQLRTSEAQLRQAQKMEAVGQLTGGVAHDFNNLLAVIQGNTELLIGQARGADPLLQAILRAAHRGGELTQRLLAFSRRQPLHAEPIDLSDVVFKMSDLLARTLGETVEIETRAAPNLKPALADPGQVEIALLNLAINARDAMPGGGRVTIECLVAGGVPSSLVDDPDAPVGDYLVLAVSDTGAGMSAAVKEHAIEPFFTTKEVGLGSGLGLSMVYGFAKQSGGHLAIESEEGRGTTVKLYLPMAGAAEVEPEKASPVGEAPQGRGETVLVIEDNDDVRALVCNMLAGLGYDVVAAQDIAAARTAMAPGRKVDLILSDVILPGGTSGPEFVEAMRADVPEIKVVYMSGYPTQAADREGSWEWGEALLIKPFKLGQLARALREVLD